MKPQNQRHLEHQQTTGRETHGQRSWPNWAPTPTRPHDESNRRDPNRAQKGQRRDVRAWLRPTRG